MAVDPQVEEGIHPVEIDEDALALPGLGQGETAAVGTHFVAGLVHRPVFRRRTHHAQAPVVGLDLLPPGHVDIDIDGRPVALAAVGAEAGNVPVGRHGDLVPGRIAVIFLEKIHGPGIRVGSPVEAPGPVEAHPAVAVLREYLPGGIDVRERKEPGVGLFFVQCQLPGRLPFVAGGRIPVTIGETGQQEGQQECEHELVIFCSWVLANLRFFLYLYKAACQFTKKQILISNL